MHTWLNTQKEVRGLDCGCTNYLSNRWMRRRIAEMVSDALSALAQAEDLPQKVADACFVVERPGDPTHGDAATNAALTLAQQAGMPPRQLAEQIVDALQQSVAGSEYLSGIDVGGPGFINFKISNSFRWDMLRDIRRAGEDYGKTDTGAGRRVLLEFVSANPTGPLVVVQARAAALGDVLCNLLRKTGWAAHSEYYVNDSGGQIETLGLSMEIRLRQLDGEDAEIPENAYPGEYVRQLAERFRLRHPADAGRIWQLSERQRRELLGRFAADEIVKQHRALLDRYGVSFDRWYRESEIRQQGGPQAVVNRLRRQGLAYEREGAVWLRSTEFGDERDRVLVKSDGSYTYLLPDIAYHVSKFERGFDRLIDILGPDHHGHVPGLHAGIQGMGMDPDALEVVISQWVRLLREGAEVSMSKRAGTFVTMEQLLDEVGRDAARFFFIMRAPSSPLDFDLELAKSQSDENPVYYVKYAHARLCSIFAQATQKGVDVRSEDLTGADLSVLTHEAEHGLIRRLGDFPEVIGQAAGSLEPQRLANYLLELAADFHNFYTHCRVLGDDSKTTAARLYLCCCCRVVIAEGLRILGVEAVQKM